MIKKLFRQIYYFLFDIIMSFRNLNSDKNFIVIFPRLISNILMKVLIYDKKNKKFFTQSARNKFDILTIFEIFAQESYQLNNLKHWEKINKKFINLKNNYNKPLLIDCGSNIGSSCEYFSRIFENIYSILVEPNKENAEFCKKNIYNENYQILNNAISSEKKIVKINDKTQDYRAFRVDPFIGKDVETNTVNNILSNNKEFKSFIIKIDIEGYEDNLFKKNFEWINEFEIIIIEIHDWMLPYKSTSNNFFKALNETMQNNFKRDIIISGENLILIKNNPNEIY